MIVRVAAVISVVLLGAVVAFQIALVLGAPWGDYTQGGAATGSLPTSGRVLAALSIVILTAFALAILARVGWGPLRGAPRRLVSVLAWISVAYAVVAVVLNAATPSARERMVWVPVSVVLLVTQFTTVMGTRRRGGG